MSTYYYYSRLLNHQIRRFLYPIWLSVIFCLTPIISATGQNPTLYLPGLSVDSIALLSSYPYLALKSDHSWYQYDLVNLPKHLLQNQAENLEKPSVSFFIDDTIRHYTSFQDGYLLVLNDGLHHLDGIHLRKMHVPFEDNSNDITAVSACADRFLLLRNGEIWFWDPISYLFQHIKTESQYHIVSAHCDDWGYYWLSNGRILQPIFSGTGSRLPYIELENVYNPDADHVYPEAFKVKVFHPEIDKIKIEYRIKGSDADWRSINNQETFHPSIPVSGGGTLEARATLDGQYYSYAKPVYAGQPTRPSLVWIYWVGMIVLGWIATSVYFYKREQRLLQRLEKQKGFYQMQWEMQKAKEDIARMQMNPHFIFNALNSIYALINLQENEKAKSYLLQFSGLLRSVLHYGNSESISLKQEITDLKYYLSLEKLASGDSFEYSIHSSIDENIQIPPMLIQPIVENAIVHGIKKKKSNGHINLNFLQEADFVIVHVEDNGVGRSASSENKIDLHSSAATGIIKERLNRISKFRKGSLTFEDLYDENGSPAGTVAIVKIPVTFKG